MTTQPDIMKTDSQSKSAPVDGRIGEFNALIATALERLKAELRARLSSMLDLAEMYLSDLSEMPESIGDHDPEFDDAADEKEDYYKKLIQLLATERSNIEKAFFQALHENAGQNTSQSDELPLGNTLSLVDQDEMDEMVAVTAMYSNAMALYEEEVNDLQARFEYLETSSNFRLPKYIFDPRHICGAFQTALKRVEMSLSYRLVMFKLFDQDVSSRLGDTYKAINQLFIEAGVLPEVVYSLRHQDPGTQSDHRNSSIEDPGSSDADSPAQSGATAETAEHGQQNDAGGGVSGLPQKISRFIGQFMKGLTSVKGEGVPSSFTADPNDSDTDRCYSRDDLMGALSKIQTDMAGAESEHVSAIDAEHIKRAVIADMGRSNGGAVTKTVHVIDQRCIDFVGMLFQAIAKDESIPMVITNLLMYLQIPIIKVAMLDENLFMQEDHPARKTLNLLTKAGRGVSDTTDRVYGELKRIIDRIVQEYDVDLASFDLAVDDLQALIRNEEAIAVETERSEQHAIIKQHAREVVLKEMRRITTHKVIPKDVRPLVLKYWPTLMFNHYMSHGIESDEWLLSLKLFRLMMEHMQPIHDESQWKTLKDNHQALINSIIKELYKTRQHKAEIDAQVSALVQVYRRMLDAYQDQVEKVPETPVQADEAAAPDHFETNGAAQEKNIEDHDDNQAARIEEQLRIARGKISKLPSDVQPGVWFEVFNGEDKPVRHLKLSVVLTDVAKLVFVDRHGVKVMEKDAEDFLLELNSGQSRLIANHSTFEHALGAVIHHIAE